MGICLKGSPFRDSFCPCVLVVAVPFAPIPDSPRIASTVRQHIDPISEVPSSYFPRTERGAIEKPHEHPPGPVNSGDPEEIVKSNVGV